MSSAICFNLDQSKILSSGNGLKGLLVVEPVKHRNLLNHLSLTVNTLPNNKILDMTNLKAFANDKINAFHMTKSVLCRVENIVGRREYSCFRSVRFTGNRHLL